MRRPRWFDGHEQERLSALLDDELDDDAALRVSQHVVACDRCRREFDAIRAAREALRSLPAVEPPVDLYTLAGPTSAGPDVRPRAPARLAVTVAASLALAVSAVLVSGATDGRTISPPVDVFVVDHVTTTGGGPLLMPVDLGR